MKKLIFTISFISLLAAGCGAKQLQTNQTNMKLPTSETAFKNAIDNDDASALDILFKKGATANDRWEYNTTPVEYAVAQKKKKALAYLLANGGDPNLRDTEFASAEKKDPSTMASYETGDTAMTLAVRTYSQDPEILSMVLKAGGDPNTKRADGHPIIVRFISDQNCDGIKFMKTAGADINARNRSGDPLILGAGIVEYWDVVSCFLDLGAKYNYTNESLTWAQIFSSPEVTPPGSPLWPYKVKVWKYLTSHGVPIPPIQ